MKNENTIQSIIYNILPHGVRDSFVRDLTEIEATPMQQAVESVAFIPVAYKAQALEAFNKWAFIGAGLLLIFCFGWSAGPRAAALLVGLVLLALVARDGYLHRKKLRADAPPMLQHSLDSVGDAATAGLFALVAQCMMLEFSPPSALPVALLWRGAVICLPLIFVLKMMFRVKPDPNKPFHGGEVDPEKIYRQVWHLTILWHVTFSGVVLSNVTDVPNYWPDFLRGGPSDDFVRCVVRHSKRLPWAVQPDPVAVHERGKGRAWPEARKPGEGAPAERAVLRGIRRSARLHVRPDRTLDSRLGAALAHRTFAAVKFSAGHRRDALRRRFPALVEICSGSASLRGASAECVTTGDRCVGDFAVFSEIHVPGFVVLSFEILT
jgi:hypothetical protein